MCSTPNEVTTAQRMLNAEDKNLKTMKGGNLKKGQFKGVVAETTYFANRKLPA